MKIARRTVGVACALALTSTSVSAETYVSAGVIGAFSPQVYKDTDTDPLVVPTVNVDTDHFYFRGLTAGARLAPKDSTHNLVLSATYDPRRFDPADTDDPQLSRLDKRDASIVAALAYQYRSPIGRFQVLAGEGVTHDRDGVYGEVSWKYGFNHPRWGISPEVGYAYNSHELNQYLYGVNATEASRVSGIEAYEPGSAGHYFVGASGYFMLTERIQLLGGVRYTNLDDEIANSPMVDQSTAASGYLGVNYVFM
ncbi:MipA/OmpV family protein [Salinivibrio socompensis]|nr:MipA/OmpV family protein [Salinivibrio socompensis]